MWESKLPCVMLLSKVRIHFYTSTLVFQPHSLARSEMVLLALCKNHCSLVHTVLLLGHLGFVGSFFTRQHQMQTGDENAATPLLARKKEVRYQAAMDHSGGQITGVTFEGHFEENSEKANKNQQCNFVFAEFCVLYFPNESPNLDPRAQQFHSTAFAFHFCL